MPFTFPTATTGLEQTSDSIVFPLGTQCMTAQNNTTISFGSSTPSSTTPVSSMWGGSSAASLSSSTSAFGQCSNANVSATTNGVTSMGVSKMTKATSPIESQCMSSQTSSPITFGLSTPSSTLTFGSSIPSSTIPISCPIMWGGSSSGSMSLFTSAFGQSSNANVSAPTNNVMSVGVSGMKKAFSSFSGTGPSSGISPFASGQHSNLFSYSNTPPLTIFGQSTGLFPSYPTNGGKTVSHSGPKATSPSSNIRGSSTDGKTDACAGKESKQQPKLQCDEIEKSVQLICKDITRHQEDMKSWIERYRSLELEKIEDTQTINLLREELAQATKSKDAIIAEYLESPAFTKRLDEDHEKRLSKIFQPSYVKALHTVQTKVPKKSRRKHNRANQVTKKEQEETSL